MKAHDHVPRETELPRNLAVLKQTLSYGLSKEKYWLT